MDLLQEGQGRFFDTGLMERTCVVAGAVTRRGYQTGGKGRSRT